MPAPQAPSGGVQLTRRRVVLAGVGAGSLAALAGCSLRIGQPVAEPTATGPDDDTLARQRVAATADELAASAMAAARLRPDQARLLTRIAAEHREHSAALRPSPVAGPPAATTTASQPASTARRTAISRQAAAELAAVSSAEQELAAVSPDVARLIASVAASRSVHAELLGSVAS